WVRNDGAHPHGASRERCYLTGEYLRGVHLHVDPATPWALREPFERAAEVSAVHRVAERAREHAADVWVQVVGALCLADQRTIHLDFADLHLRRLVALRLRRKQVLTGA